MKMNKILFFVILMLTLIAKSANALTVVVKNYSDVEVRVHPIYTGASKKWSGDLYSRNDMQYPNSVKEVRYNTGLQHLRGLLVQSEFNNVTVCLFFDFDMYITQILKQNKLRGLGTIEVSIMKNKVTGFWINIFGHTEAIPLAINKVRYDILQGIAITCP
jgi:hypothetical protein